MNSASYNFPYLDPLVATIASSLPMTNMEYQMLHIVIRPERKNVKLFENRHKVGVTLYEQKNKKAPLAFVISGTGGTAITEKALLLAEQLYGMGYHVASVPNPMNFQFVLGVSRTGLPGYLPKDAEEYYDFLIKVQEMLVKDKKLKISHVSLVGYSLGGLLAGFLAQLDSEAQIFNFHRIVMLNPALDLSFAIHQLDRFYDAGSNYSEKDKNELMGKILSFGFDVMEKKLSQSEIIQSINGFKFHSNQEKWVIGENFRRDLGDVILSSQQIHDNGVLKTPITRYRMNARENEIHNISFKDYIQKFLVPSLPQELRSLPVSLLMEKSSLYSLSETFRKNKNIYVFDNTDDFLIQEKDFNFLNEFFDEQHLYLYPSGGHCGNYWMDENKNDFIEVMKLN